MSENTKCTRRGFLQGLVGAATLALAAGLCAGDARAADDLLIELAQRLVLDRDPAGPALDRDATFGLMHLVSEFLLAGHDSLAPFTGDKSSLPAVLCEHPSTSNFGILHAPSSPHHENLRALRRRL